MYAQSHDGFYVIIRYAIRRASVFYRIHTLANQLETHTNTHTYILVYNLDTHTNTKTNLKHTHTNLTNAKTHENKLGTHTNLTNTRKQTLHTHKLDKHINT